MSLVLTSLMMEAVAEQVAEQVTMKGQEQELKSD
jgi:hypothetical protein